MKDEKAMREGRFLMVGHSETEVIIDHHNIQIDTDGVGFIAFSPAEARNLARILISHAKQVDAERKALQKRERAS